MITVDTYLELSKGKGIGLFAAQFIPKGTIWWVRNEQFDKLITQNDIKILNKYQVEFIKTYGFLEATNNWYLCIDNSRFSNHSDSPNSLNNFNEKKEIISCITSKDIGIGEEILCNYKETCLDCIDSLGFEVTTD